LALRSKIVLACATGKTNREVAAELHCNKWTLGKWRQRFVDKRLKGLADEYRPGVPRTVTDDHVEAVVVKTLTEKPTDATHWSTRSLARATGMSQPTIARIWKAFGLKPWQEDTFKLSEDPLFIDKVRDVVGLYLNPPERAVVLCVDEKTQVQALDRTQPIFPMLPDVPQRRSHDYVRHGTIDLYAALDLASGAVLHQLTKRHRAIDGSKLVATHVRAVGKAPRSSTWTTTSRPPDSKAAPIEVRRAGIRWLRPLIPPARHERRQRSAPGRLSECEERRLSPPMTLIEYWSSTETEGGVTATSSPRFVEHNDGLHRCELWQLLAGCPSSCPSIRTC
jgi:transposase